MQLFFAGILGRMGLGVLAPFALGIAAFVGFSLFGLSAWLLEWTDGGTAILLVMAGALVIQLTQVETSWSKALIAVIVALTCYIKGRIDESIKTTELVEAAREQVHAQYKATTDAEQKRQSDIAARLKEQAELERANWQAERQRLQDALQLAREEAKRDPNANRPALGPDSVRRLNRLRADGSPREGRGSRSQTKR